MSDVLELPFDQYQRYRLVSDVVERLRAARGGGRLRILDVGGRTAILRSFLPDDRVELVDLEPSRERGLVLGDGSRLPFRDGAVDLVAAFDTLEHVPPARREAFVAECARVARSWVVLAGPYGAPEVDAAEELLASFLREKLELEHRYLAEHRANGLPERAAVEARLAAAGAELRSVGHGDLDRWLVLMCMEMYMDHDPLLRPLAARFFRFYNASLYASDQGSRVYRHAVVAAFGGAPLPADGLFAPRPAPPDALASVAPLAAELLAFDREKDAWRAEFARLEGIIAAVQADVEGHRARLSDTAADLAETRKSLSELEEIHERALREGAEERGTLEADLRATRASLEELAEIRARAEREQAEVEATLRAELDATAAGLAELRGIHEEAERGHARTEAALRAEIDAYQRVRGELEGVLAQTRSGAEAIQSELLRARGDIDGLLSQIERMDAEITRLRAELRDRWRNLRRAFAWKKPQF